MQKIPDEIKSGCPDNCPKCGKAIWMVFRSWRSSSNTVKVEFSHIGRLKKDCVKIYKY